MNFVTSEPSLYLFSLQPMTSERGCYVKTVKGIKVKDNVHLMNKVKHRNRIRYVVNKYNGPGIGLHVSTQ